MRRPRSVAISCTKARSPSTASASPSPSCRDTATRVRFEVAVIPHTLAVTTLGPKQAGESVNVEVDMLAKYVERLTSERE